MTFRLNQFFLFGNMFYRSCQKKTITFEGVKLSHIKGKEGSTLTRRVLEIEPSPLFCSQIYFLQTITIKHILMKNYQWILFTSILNTYNFYSIFPKIKKYGFKLCFKIHLISTLLSSILLWFVCLVLKVSNI